MKKIFLLITAIALFSSCADEDFDINRDPDNLTNVNLSVQLPAGIVGVVGAQGSVYALIGGFWSQFWTQGNTSSQYIEIDSYIIGTLDYNAGWTAMYDALGDLRTIKRKAETQGNWNYYLIATTMEVQASQTMVDFYDQIPYSEANNADILQPAFESGSAVYDKMVADLQLALSKDLSTSQGEVPGADDFIFGGNMANWTAYANTLMLKLYMRQTEARPAVAQAGIEALLASGVAFLDADAAMTQFEDAPNKSNPLFETDRRQLNTGNNLRASKTMFSFFDENGDTRSAAYYGVGNPLDQGDFNSTAGTISIVNLSPTTAVYLMSREESLFLQAEAAVRYNGGTGAQALYNAGVIENFSKWGLDGSGYVAAGGAYDFAAAATMDEQIEAIITQKWAASFPGNGFESFFEQNRTGYPAISPVPSSDAGYIPGQLSYSVNGSTGGDFPRRLVYPENVTSTNENAPDLVELTVPVWWDVN